MFYKHLLFSFDFFCFHWQENACIVDGFKASSVWDQGFICMIGCSEVFIAYRDETHFL